MRRGTFLMVIFVSKSYGTYICTGSQRLDKVYWIGKVFRAIINLIYCLVAYRGAGWGRVSYHTVTICFPGMLYNTISSSPLSWSQGRYSLVDARHMSRFLCSISLCSLLLTFPLCLAFFLLSAALALSLATCWAATLLAIICCAAWLIIITRPAAVKIMIILQVITKVMWILCGPYQVVL